MSDPQPVWQPLTLRQGETLELYVFAVPAALGTLVGATARLVIRAAADPDSALLVTATTAAGGLALDATARTITPTLAQISAAVTSGWAAGGYWHEVTVTLASGAVHLVARGRVSVLAALPGTGIPSGALTEVAVDGVTITGDGTDADPLVVVGLDAATRAVVASTDTPTAADDVLELQVQCTVTLADALPIGTTLKFYDLTRNAAAAPHLFVPGGSKTIMGGVQAQWSTSGGEVTVYKALDGNWFATGLVGVAASIVDFTVLSEGGTVLPTSASLVRASTADYDGANGTAPVLGVAINTPRVLASPTGEVGVLVEEARTRIVAEHSRMGTAYGWTAGTVTPPAPQAITGLGGLTEGTRLTVGAEGYAPFLALSGAPFAAGGYAQVQVFKRAFSGTSAQSTVTGGNEGGIQADGEASVTTAWGRKRVDRLTGATLNVFVEDCRGAWTDQECDYGIGSHSADVLAAGVSVHAGAARGWTHATYSGSRAAERITLTSRMSDAVSVGTLKVLLRFTSTNDLRVWTAEACLGDFNNTYVTVNPANGRVKVYVAGSLFYTSTRQAAWGADAVVDVALVVGSGSALKLAYRVNGGTWKRLDAGDGGTASALAGTGNITLGAKADGTMVVTSALFHKLQFLATDPFTAAASAGTGPQFVAMGDSLMAGLRSQYHADSITSKIAALLPTWDSWNVAIPGRTAQSMLAGTDWTVPASSVRSRQVLLILAGTNDIAGGRTDAQTLADLTSIVTAAKALYHRVVIGTIPKRTEFDGNPTREGYRVSVNTSLLAGASGADAVVDIAAQSVFATSSSSGYLRDHVHFHKSGRTVVANLYAPQIF